MGETNNASGSDYAGSILLEKGKRDFREILGGSGLEANDPWLRDVEEWIARATTQCWRSVPAMKCYRINPTTKALIECTYERMNISLDCFKEKWKGHVKAREKARSSKHAGDKDKERKSKHAGDSKNRASKHAGDSKYRDSKHAGDSKYRASKHAGD